MRPDEKRVARAEAMWALVVGAVAFITPWILFLAVPPASEIEMDTGCTLCMPWWAPWGPLLVWILGGTLGVALVIVGDRVRRIGAACLIGDALGVLLFFISLAVAFSIPTG